MFENSSPLHIKKMFCLSGKENEICQMYQQGLTTYQIAKKFNVSQKSIYNKLKKRNMVLREKGKRYLLESDKEKIISLYKTGYSILALCKKFNCSWLTVKSLLDRENVPKIKPTIFKTARKNKWGELGPKIEKLFNKGITVRQISQELGTSISTIRYYIRLKGLTRNPILNNRHTFAKSDLVIELYTKNLLSKAKIAKQLRCGVNTVSRVLQENNIASREKLIEEKIKKLYEQGLTYEKIGQKMGMSVSGISHFVKNKGWHRKQISKTTNLSYSTIQKILIQEGGYNA